uniref:FHA domain-containing protein n=1 Tax=Euplotes crassus TaxID=5936 RepID=A0A7S3KJL5_EUPCR|mmetsp:Transcript_26135/g.25994  ORF Transcript_26135/g.25994 Transcript_26135/m.25994 type:complete len:219 (+) Transcript_26135:808-1464(+)
MLNGKRWNLVDLKRPSDKDTPYIILESLNSEKNSSRTIHIVTINTEKTAFSLGRGHDSDLRINDISVSRKHANIEYRDGKFMFVDLKSKFGTLALLSDDVELELDNSQTFQIGRTVVTLKAKATQPWKNREKQSEFSLIKPDRSEFLQNTSNLIPSSNSPKSSGNSDDNKNPNCIPTFEANDRDQALEDRQQHIIEIDGKRYLVVQELDPAEENLPEI